MFGYNRKGIKDAVAYLKEKNKMSDFWYHPSSHDMVTHANRILNES